jgi:hypothetical protein
MFWTFDLREGPQSGHFRWPPFCQDVSREKLTKNNFLAIWPRGGSPKWPLPMATILPVNSPKKFNFWTFDLRECSQVATSNDNFSTMSLLCQYSNKRSHICFKKHFLPLSVGRR